MWLLKNRRSTTETSAVDIKTQQEHIAAASCGHTALRLVSLSQGKQHGSSCSPERTLDLFSQVLLFTHMGFDSAYSPIHNHLHIHMEKRYTYNLNRHWSQICMQSVSEAQVITRLVLQMTIEKCGFVVPV